MEAKDTTERYTLGEKLGEGGFGSVYKATDNTLQREVAIKRLDKGLMDKETREQLIKEARVLAAIQHSNIVSIYDVSSHDDFDEIVMELAKGVSLDALVQRHLLLPFDFVNVAGQILGALSAAHERGVLHCDVKPENMMLCMASAARYEVKVYDFGMSEPVTKEEKVGKSKLVGSIYVMAPELFDGALPTEQSDLYGLGCVFYYLLTGTYPFNGDSSIQVMASHITGNCKPVQTIRTDLTHQLCLWLEKLMKKETAERFSSCSEALDALMEIEIHERKQEFTLSTSLELESNNSRVVRPISADSLAKDYKVSKTTQSGPSNTTVFLSNSLPKTSPVRCNPVMSAINKPEEPLVTGLEEEVTALPKGAEWYFFVKESAKGPVTLEQLQKLCAEKKVLPSTLIWHPTFGEWVQASGCSDTNEVFLWMEQEEQGRIRRERLQKEAEEARLLELAKAEEEVKKSGFGRYFKSPLFNRRKGTS